ncbi:MAG: NIL domain-containing protein [Chlamydiae bacterium]|nr:NIL domain-containing protein [Chlamydiota bacterium]MBI3278075.1 NIL domain-containing protein [Chlamydiota bacterium]
MKRKVYLTFPEILIKEPVIYELGHKFKVVTNVRSASVSTGVGLIALEMDGEKEEVEKAIKHLKDLGIKVKPIEHDVVE